MIAVKSEVIKKGKKYLKGRRETFIAFAILCLTVGSIFTISSFISLNNSIKTIEGRIGYFVSLFSIIIPHFIVGIIFIIIPIIESKDPLLAGCKVTALEFNKKIEDENEERRKVECISALIHKEKIYYSKYNTYRFNYKDIYEKLKDKEALNFIPPTIMITVKHHINPPQRKRKHKSSHNWDTDLDDGEYQELGEMMDEE